jgi:tRNA modification GTPase
MNEADLVLYLFDVNEEQPEDVSRRVEELKKEEIRCLLVANKVDLIDEPSAREKFATVGEVIFISAKTNLHLEVLKERMVDMVLQGNLETEDTIVTNARHYHALRKVHDALKDIYVGLQNNIPGDLLALDIRTCLHYLGEITGEVTNEDLLDYVFSKFCIGK